MANITAGSGTAALHQHYQRRRRWVRHEQSIRPFFWHGLLPVLGLLLLAGYAVWPFAQGQIENQVEREIGLTLHQEGHRWVRTEVSGQHVVLSGTPPDAKAGDIALALARQTACPNWWGPLTCAVDVRGEFGAANGAPAKADAASAAASVPASAAAVAAAPSASAVAAAASCERELAAVVKRSSIRFATSSAAIQPTSNATLDALARIARNCQAGRILIEGHTDASGRAEANQTLSAARADAVRQALITRGLPAARLQAQGFGSSQPVAGNDAEDGRARNRRIEFRVAPLR